MPAAKEKKRPRSPSSGAAHPPGTCDRGAAASPSPSLTACDGRSDGVSAAPAATTDPNSDYVALVERSAALLDKIRGRRAHSSAPPSIQAAGSVPVHNEPLTLPYTLDKLEPRTCSGVAEDTAYGDDVHLCDYTAATQMASPCRRSAATQTETAGSLESQKEQLLLEVSEFFTLLHVLFA